MIFSMVLISISTLLLITGFLFYFFFIMKIYAEVELYGDYFIQIYYENLKKHIINSDL